MIAEEKLIKIENVLKDFFDNDDSYVVDTIVSKIRESIKDDKFAYGACLRDENYN